MLRLHDFAPSANCYKARLLLAQLGTPYQRVPVDIFAGDSQTDDYLARNPAGRTPVLELESGESIPESNAILLWLAQQTPFLPEAPIEQARVWGWLFFEQNLLEPNVGTARFWRLTGRDAQRPEAFARHLEAGRSALGVLERHLDGNDYLVADRYSIADTALYAYAHVAGDAGIDLEDCPAAVAWLRRVEAQPGYLNDLEPYPPQAMAGAGSDSVHG